MQSYGTSQNQHGASESQQPPLAPASGPLESTLRACAPTIARTCSVEVLGGEGRGTQCHCVGQWVRGKILLPLCFQWLDVVDEIDVSNWRQSTSSPLRRLDIPFLENRDRVGMGRSVCMAALKCFTCSKVVSQEINLSKKMMPSWPAIHVSHNGVVSGKRGEN